MKKMVKALVIFLMISIFLEVFVFNFRWLTTLFNEGEVIKNISYSDGIEETSDGLIFDKDDYIEIKNINKKVKNLNLDITIKDGRKYLSLGIYAKDEGNKLYYKANDRYLYPNIERSHYISLDLSGKADSIKIQFNLGDEETTVLDINKIVINDNIPIDISFTRLIFTFLIITILYIIRPKSPLYKYKVDFKNKFQILSIGIVLVGQALFFLYVLNANEAIKTLENYSNHRQYQELAKSLSKGKVYLEIEPSLELKELDNPYDYYYREKLIKENNAHFEWDHAYYKGKYYVYFGVVPVLTSYLPYYLITGNALPNYVVIFIVSIMAMIGLFLLLKEIVKRYFKNTPFLLFLLLYVFFTTGCGLLNILGYAALYNVPIVYAMMFTFFGLYFFISSIKKEKISKIRIFLGSLCMALVAGCRPQFLVFSFLAVPIFYEEIFKKRNLFSKKSIITTFWSIIPYIVVAGALMFYNKVRFDSFFDFGANYNITSNDMTVRGFNLDRIGLGLFTYLLQPFNLTATFPFLLPSTFTTNYIGITIYSTFYGGALFTSPLLILGILFFKFKKLIPKKLFYICLISVISAFIVIIADTQMAGLIPRYFSDFLSLLYLATFIVILSIYNANIPKKFLDIFLTVIICLVIYKLGYQFLYIFYDQSFSNMLSSSTEFYFKWYYLLQWWL